MNDYPAAIWHAWERRKRPAWPATLAGVMADPILGRLVMLEALHGSPVARREPVQAPIPPVDSSPVAQRGNMPRDVTPIWRGPYRVPTLDRKSLAAGERPDSDE